LFIFKLKRYVNYAEYVFIFIILFSSPYNIRINSIKIINILLTKKNIIFNFLKKKKIEQILHSFFFKVTREIIFNKFNFNEIHCFEK